MSDQKQIGADELVRLLKECAKDQAYISVAPNIDDETGLEDPLTNRIIIDGCFDLEKLLASIASLPV